MKYSPINNNPNVSESRSESISPCLKVDSRGFPCISWIDKKNGINEVMYSFWDGLKWSYYDVPRVAFSNEDIIYSPNSLVLDENDSPVISFANKIDNGFRLSLAKRDNDWVFSNYDVNYDVKWIGVVKFDRSFDQDFSSSSSSASSSTSSSNSSSTSSSTSSSNSSSTSSSNSSSTSSSTFFIKTSDSSTSSSTSENDYWVWTERTNSGKRVWKSVACSYSSNASVDGKYLAAVYNDINGYIMTSTDYGQTWHAVTDHQKYWYGIASSSDGSKLAACTYGEYIYTSTNYGNDKWIPRLSAGARNWTAIASSSDGAKLFACARATYYYSGDGAICTSSDYGVSWALRTSAPSRMWTSIASSADGSRLIACAHYSYGVYLSSDSGATWSMSSLSDTGLKMWNSVASSINGSTLVACESQPNSPDGYIYVSVDYGASWSKRTVAGNNRWISVACSSDGSRIIAFNAYGSSSEIVYSANYGINWESMSVPLEYSFGGEGGITLSYDGLRAVVLSEFSNIYTGYNHFVDISSGSSYSDSSISRSESSFSSQSISSESTSSIDSSSSSSISYSFSTSSISIVSGSSSSSISFSSASTISESTISSSSSSIDSHSSTSSLSSVSSSSISSISTDSSYSTSNIYSSSSSMIYSSSSSELYTSSTEYLSSSSYDNVVFYSVIYDDTNEKIKVYLIDDNSWTLYGQFDLFIEDLSSFKIDICGQRIGLCYVGNDSLLSGSSSSYSSYTYEYEKYIKYNFFDLFSLSWMFPAEFRSSIYSSIYGEILDFSMAGSYDENSSLMYFAWVSRTQEKYYINSTCAYETGVEIPSDRISEIIESYDISVIAPSDYIVNGYKKIDICLNEYSMPIIVGMGLSSRIFTLVQSGAIGIWNNEFIDIEGIGNGIVVNCLNIENNKISFSSDSGDIYYFEKSNDASFLMSNPNIILLNDKWAYKSIYTDGQLNGLDIEGTYNNQIGIILDDKERPLLITNNQSIPITTTTTTSTLL